VHGSIDNSGGKKLHSVRRSIYVALFAVIGLVAVDVLINFIFAYPSDPRVTKPSSLRLYFEYGRSAEGQLVRMTRPDRSETAPITLTGWYDPLQPIELPSKAHNPIVTFYGLSHAVKLAYALGRVSDRFTPRIVGAPSATSNWSYGAYLRDRGGGKSHVVVLAFSAQTLPWITSMSPMTFVFDRPMPYTSDRFYVEGDQLRVIHPPYASFDGFVQTFYDPAKWSTALSFFAKNDPMYNGFMMRTSILDHSSLFRLVRRAVGQHVLADTGAAVIDKAGFKPDSEQVKVAEAIIHEFAINARSDGMIPVIYLVNNLGYSDYLFRALSPMLRADHIPYLSSHTIVSADNPRGYLPDTHFTDEVDDKLANALIDVIDHEDQHLSAKSGGS
jgi:hypothetical protein